MKPIPVNGIRLGPGLVRTGHHSQGTAPGYPVCQALAIQRVNMVCAGLHRRETRETFSGCVESGFREYLTRLARDTATVTPPAEVTQVFVYPHRRRLEVPAVLMDTLDTADIPFHHLVTSPAVISVIIDTRYQDQVIALLENTFALPASHTPYIQEIDQDISALLKKYPETRSTYVEEKIRTYGLQLTLDVVLAQTRGPRGCLARFRDRLAAEWGTEAVFHLVSVIQAPGGTMDAVFVMESGRSGPAGEVCEPVDLVTFHGPHFGDRYRILQTALNCLEIEGVPLRAAACAGASISLVFPAGAGTAAKTALTRGFEAP
jgi:hypothetical protein